MPPHDDVVKTPRRHGGSTTEARLVAALRSLFGGAAGTRAAVLGIGDDAAVLRPSPGRLVWTVDTSVEGVHFERRSLSFADIGARSFHAAVSDVAAMGGKPTCALSSLIVPRSLSERDVLSIAKGQAFAAAELGCPVVGGNLSKGAELSVTTTVIGSAVTPLTRDGARPGDDVWLVGDVGLSSAGLAWLKTRRRIDKLDAASRRAVEACVTAWRRPKALIRDGRGLVGRARSAIDVSDGLATDAARVASASGVRFVIESAALTRALRRELIVASTVLGLDPTALALAGGEDYALVATGPAAAKPRRARRIGRVEAGRGIRFEMSNGRLVSPPAGFDHFSGR